MRYTSQFQSWDKGGGGDGGRWGCLLEEIRYVDFKITFAVILLASVSSFVAALVGWDLWIPISQSTMNYRLSTLLTYLKTKANWSKVKVSAKYNLHKNHKIPSKIPSKLRHQNLSCLFAQISAQS